MEELVEEILLRLPPDDPASLVRAALVCRLWRRLASAPAFRRRFREFHRTAPVLGVLCRGQCDSDDEEDLLPTACFCPTSSFRPARADHYGCRVIDARHGRVLLHREPSGPGPWRIDLTVWNPITDEQQELPSLPIHGAWNAAVVCAAGSSGSCDHLDCHRGSFLVVVVFIYISIRLDRMFTLIYTSEGNAWSEVASTNRRYLYNYFETSARGVLLDSALYLLARSNVGIVKYNMTTQEISTMDLISKFSHQNIVLMTMEDCKLVFATTDAMSSTCKLIHLWSWEDDGPDRVARFVLSRVIDLEKLLPASTLDKALIRVNGFADDARVLFVYTWHGGLYSIDIKSEQVKEVSDCYAYHCAIPYMSFHTPALGAGSPAPGGPRCS